MKYVLQFESAASRPHGVLLASPTVSVSSTLLFSVDSQPEHYKRLAHSFKNIGGYTPKSESQAKPSFQNGTQLEQVSILR